MSPTLLSFCAFSSGLMPSTGQFLSYNLVSVSVIWTQFATHHYLPAAPLHTSSYSCFQVKHSSLGHPGLGTILRRLMWLHFHCIHHNSQKRSRTLATHRIRMKFCQGKRPSFLSQEQLPRCKDPLSYVCIFYLSIYISCLIIYFRAIDHKIGFFVNPIFC